ncbi:MAG: preprotein translocase subunit YajC [Myxococcales bacterium]|nr:preprotein translocase subunit YajC [Myxococcota bacterium]MDW8282278.1 preprotein translocase subunit YajC [Myxococcales bacterium]
MLLALADGPAPASGGGPLGAAGAFVPLLIMFLIFYFLLIRPQQKKQREHQEMLRNLQKEDEVYTQGGLVGKIKGLTDQFVTLELQEKVRVRVLRSHIAGKIPATGPGAGQGAAQGKPAQPPQAAK